MPVTGIEQILLKQGNNLANKLWYITVFITRETPSLIMHPKENSLSIIYNVVLTLDTDLRSISLL